MALGSGQFANQRSARPHLVNPGGGLAGELYDLRKDLQADFAANAAIAVEEWTNAPVASTTAIRTAQATVTTVRTLSGSALNGVLGSGVMDPPRSVSVTTAGVTPANAPATVTINGKDVNGDDLSEVVTVSQTAATVESVKAFKQVTSIVEAAGDGVAATLAYGFGVKIGLGKKIKSRAGAIGALVEITGGARLAADAITGTLVDAATSAPNGTYSPAAAPDGTRDYALYYEYDASVNR